MQRRLRLLLWAQGAALSLDDLEHEDIEECEICWQGGETMIMGLARRLNAKGLYIGQRSMVCSEMLCRRTQDFLLLCDPFKEASEQECC